MGEDCRLEEPHKAELPAADARLAEDIAALCGLSLLLANCAGPIPPSPALKEIGRWRDEINGLLKQLMGRHRLTTESLLMAAAHIAARLYPLKTDKG